MQLSNNITYLWQILSPMAMIFLLFDCVLMHFFLCCDVIFNMLCVLFHLVHDIYLG